VTPPPTNELLAAAAHLMDAAGLGRVMALTPVSGGRNNRGFRVAGPAGTAFLKHYPVEPGATRDRAAAEAAWYDYCRHHRIRSVPRFYGYDPSSRCLLLEEVSGRRLQPDEVNASHVRQAIRFFQDLNHDRPPSAAAIGLAAEACFSYADTVEVLERRRTRIAAVPVWDDLTASLREWSERELAPVWDARVAELRQRVPHQAWSTAWPVSARCLSPSDFGFHNALVSTTGTLNFIDFEYAGWDDPSKVVCDFYWQIQCPAPRDTSAEFLECLDAAARDRVRHLFALYGLKWCLIVLNEFLRDGQQRRAFALGLGEDRRAGQLELARQLLDQVRGLPPIPSILPEAGTRETRADILPGLRTLPDTRKGCS